MPPSSDFDALALRVNPLAGLSFEDSIDPGKFLARIESNVQDRMVEQARFSAGDVFASAIQTVSLTQNGYYVTFNNVGYELMRSGEGFKAVQMDAAGKIHALGDVSEFSRWVNSLSKVTSLVVSASHIISGADLSRRLKKVEAKLTWLEAKVEIGQRAEIHSAYEELRERFGEPAPDKGVLRNLREIFRKHRIRYIREAEASLDAMRLLRPISKPRRIDWIKGKPRVIMESAVHILGAVVPIDMAADLAKRGAEKFGEMRTAEGSTLHTQRVRELDEIAARIGMAEYCIRLETLVSGALESDYSESCRDCSKALSPLAIPMGTFEREAGATDDRADAIKCLAEAMVNVGKPE